MNWLTDSESGWLNSDQTLNVLALILTFLVAAFAFVQGSLRKQVESLKSTVAGMQTCASDLQRQINEERRRYSSLNEVIDQHEVVCVTDDHGIITHVNNKFCEISGYSREELVGKTHRIVSSGLHPKAFWKALWNTLGRGDVWHGQICNRSKDGMLYWVDATIAPFSISPRGPDAYVAIYTDVTTRKQYEDRLEAAAWTDRLTGLANRSLCFERIQKAISRCQEEPEFRFAVLMIDVDRFKLINDSISHDYGDRFLKKAADRLRTAIRPVEQISPSVTGTTVARLGGDEFLVFLEDCSGLDEVLATCNQILHQFETPLQIDDHACRSSVSIGVVMSSPQYSSADEVLRDADVAMYQAKARGKARYVLFDASMQAAVRNRHQLENDLRLAIGTDQLFVVYQPIVGLEDGRTIGVEALVRWKHPTRGLISPVDFIPIAEESRLILSLGAWVLKHACMEFVRWRRAAPDTSPKYVSVNLSPIQFVDPTLHDMIERVLEETEIPPRELQLEITESELMQDPRAAREIMRKLKARGMRLAMDDFGTGYSSLSCLHEFPFDVLKIDRAFVKNLHQNRDYVALLHSVVSLAENLGMSCIAEGIEDEEQLAVLQAMGCSSGQGFLFSRPYQNEELGRARTYSIHLEV